MFMVGCWYTAGIPPVTSGMPLVIKKSSGMQREARGNSKFQSHLKLAALTNITVSLPRKNYTKTALEAPAASGSEISI